MQYNVKINNERGNIMLSKSELNKEMAKLTNHIVNIDDSDCVHSEEMQQGDKMLTSYYFFTSIMSITASFTTRKLLKASLMHQVMSTM